MSSSVIGSTVTTGANTDARSRAQEGRSRNGNGGQGQNGGQGRNNRPNRTRSNLNGRAARASTFRGITEGMNGLVFKCYFEQGGKRQYARALEALEGYAKRT